MGNRSSFPPVFWIANSIEVLERFAYYGIYMGFGIYMEYLGYTKAQLGIVQSIFLALSYLIPVISGTFADRYGFKKVLLISYLAYLPSILLLLITKSFSGIALSMLCIGLAAGIFKPLVSGTVRVTSDSTNKTLGFGIFYAMVNTGASFGPLIAGYLRAISWNHAFIASALAIGIMFFITLLFYKEPPREIEGITLKQKFKDLGTALSDTKFLIFLLILGVFYWLPFWAFFNLLAIYIDKNIDTATLYQSIKNVLGSSIADFISRPDKNGIRHIMGETISHTGYVILALQLFVSWGSEKIKALSAFMIGLFIASLGFIFLAFGYSFSPSWIFLGIVLFAIGEMLSSPRVQEYITWIAPKEKAGLYMGSNFLAISIGGFFSGITYSSLYGYFNDNGHPQYIWYTLAVHLISGIIALYIFTKTLGEFKEQSV